MRSETFILSVDVGTTLIRCHVYDKEAKIRGSCTTKVTVASTCLFMDPELIPAEPRNVFNIMIFLLCIYYSRLYSCIQKQDTWRLTRMNSGKVLFLW